MKILMLHNRYLVPGGEDQCSAAEAALLREYGHEVEFLEEDNRRIEQLGKARTALRTIWSRESYRRIDEKLRGTNFDVMHVQNFFPLWSPSVYYAASRRHVPVVQALQNYRLMCVNSLFLRDQHVCEECLGRLLPWHGVVHACYRHSRAGSAVVATMVGAHKLAGTWRRRVTTYIAASEFMRHKYIEGGFPADQIVVKPNFMHPAPAVADGGGNYALYVGRLSPEKGIASLLDAWNSAQASLPLKIVGQGPLEELVRQYAAACAQIEYLGARSLTEVLALMGRADFLVFPSIVYEGMPRTIIESFSVGTPIVTCGTGTQASMVAEGKTGFHFEPANVADLRGRIEWCSRNLDQVRSLRLNARQAFEANYTGAANIEMLVNIYRQAQRKIAPTNRGQAIAGSAQS